MTQQNKEKEQLELLELLEAKEAQVKYNKISTLFPDSGPFSRDKYPKHVNFMNAGKKHSQRAFIAANRVGKTLTGAVETAYHLTGQYPDWWEGRKFTNAISVWAAGVSNQSTKEIQQFELLGNLDDVGTGTIPKDCIIKITKKPGVADAVETVFVKHVSGGLSQLTFKSYEQKRDSFQGTKKQVIWLDEEPSDLGIYTECLTRTMDKYNPGIILFTATPLKGRSKVMRDFLPGTKFPEDGIDPKNPYKYVVNVTWNDVPHLTEDQKEELLASYPVHERQARSQGIPSLGSGAIYPYASADIGVKPFEIPPHWKKGYGIDVGWNKTAAVFGAVDPESNMVYIYSEHYEGKAVPAIHAQAIKQRGEWLVGAMDPAAGGSSQADGRSLRELYEDCGLNLEIADNSVEAGVFRVQQMLESGQLKIFNTCRNLLYDELPSYCRDENGKVIKEYDHLVDALRYFIMTGLHFVDTEPNYSDDGFDNWWSGDKGRDDVTGY